ncbi:MAG: hypothetical protein JNM72_11425 [Deltaproteobacteria bacterium]|jgi:hypothetical protein|nr:hypothetical protein [Deltaproteobacteria bacterium]
MIRPLSLSTAGVPAAARLLSMLSVLSLTACEERLPDDKGGDDGATDGADGTDGTDGTADGTDGSTDGGSGDGGADGGTDGTDGGDGGTTDCQAEVDIAVWMDTAYMDASLLTTTPYDFDAGIAALKAALPEGEDPVEVSIPVSGAIVTTVGYAPSGSDPDIWISDANGTVLTFRAGGGTLGVMPGDKVSFTATQLTNYFDKLEITGIDGFTIDSSNNPIWYREGYDQVIDSTAWSQDLTHIWGELVTEPEACGGSYSCFDLQHGSQTIAYRVNLTNLGDYPDRNGDCIQLLAPMDTFSGAPQINIFNYDWRYVVF